MIDLPVIILCGGLGTRLRDTVADVPKVLAPIEGKPFLAYLLHFLLRQGCGRIILATGYRGELVREYVDAHGPPNMEITCVQEQQQLGTGGALAFARKSSGVDTTIIAMNGDTFFGGSIADLLRFHLQHPTAIATVALAHVKDAGRYGSVEIDGQNRVTDFGEKTTAGVPGWINAGMYVLAPSVLDNVPPLTSVSLERDIFPTIAGSGLIGLRFPNAPFLDIGTPEAYRSAAAFVTSLDKD